MTASSNNTAAGLMQAIIGNMDDTVHQFRLLKIYFKKRRTEL